MVTQSKLIKDFDIKDYLDFQFRLDTLKFLTCGSVDDGKSTLIGRMLYESHQIFEDQVATLKKDSFVSGTQGKEIDFALLVDGLSAEQEQGITIDVAYRFFSTSNRKFIVADTPGHEQYTRNMVTGASTSDLAIILVDARQGILSQTKRHSLICAKLGIRKIILAINKMDLVNFNEDTFIQIDTNFRQFAKELNFLSIVSIPISALLGENIVKISEKMPWFNGSSLLTYLETVKINEDNETQDLRLPIQYVNRRSMDFRGFSGTVASGSLKIGQKVICLPSYKSAKINDIFIHKKKIQTAIKGQSITFSLDRELDLSRGDIIFSENVIPQMSDLFEISIFWIGDEPGYVGRSYLMKINNLIISAQITKIKHKVDINSFKKLSTNELKLNDLIIATLEVDRQIPFDSYANSKELGGFILIDRFTNHTVGAGMINFSLKRSQNIKKQVTDIKTKDRNILNKHNGKILWFTGISGSGKSTIANKLEIKLHKKNIRTFILDGDNLRHGLNKDLGFSNADRIENIRRASEVAKLFLEAGIVVLTSFISPFKAEREKVKSLFEKGDFVEIFVDTPLEVAEERDPKGLYKKARAGEIPNFTGIHSPYEKPESPDLILNTVKYKPEELVDQILTKINF